jgi:DNA polymerase-1
MIALIDADSLIYVAGWHFKDSEDTEAVRLDCYSLFMDILDQTKATHYIGVFSDNDTFRHREYTQATYKGNRKGTPNWVIRWKGVIIDYLCEEFHFVKAIGLEADDIVAALHTDETVICSPDKDTKQRPGLHYDTKKKILQEIDEFQAWYNLYTQMLIGDTTDNIVGVPKVGPVTATKLLKSCTTKEELEAVVLNEYMRYFNAEGDIIYANTLNTVMMLSPNHYYWNNVLPITNMKGKDYITSFIPSEKPKRTNTDENMWNNLGW